MRALTGGLTASLVLGLSLTAAPAVAHGGGADRNREVRTQLLAESDSTPLMSGNVEHQGAYPGQLAISGCFMQTKPLFVTSGVESVRVWDVEDAVQPEEVGVLPNALFENEAMNCGERRTEDGVRRFALIGVDAVQAAPTEPQHVNAGGNELIVVEVFANKDPKIVGRAPDATTSTHTVTCVTGTDCRYAYSAGDGSSKNGSVGHFSVFDLRDIEKPKEVDSDPDQEGVQPFTSPTAGHKWNFDAAGLGTHTGWNGASIWRTDHPRHPELVTTTGEVGQGGAEGYEDWNNFILHNAFRPHAKKFRAHSSPSLDHGNVLLATEEDYEQTDCAQAGSFQSWKVKSLSGRNSSAIVPLDKVELRDLEDQNGSSLPIEHQAFCSSHWFDYSSSGIVAVGFYGGGTQFIDARDPKHLKSFGYAFWGGSEVWDAMWVPVYGKDGRQTGRDSNVVYSIDLVRGLDVYSVDVPGDGRGTMPTPSSTASTSLAETAAGGIVPLGVVAGALALAFGLRRRARQTA